MKEIKEMAKSEGLTILNAWRLNSTDKPRTSQQYDGKSLSFILKIPEGAHISFLDSLMGNRLGF